MARFIALDKTIHRESGLLPAGNDHALEKAVVPVVAEELAQVVPTMPLAFVSQGKGKAYELVALQSLQPGVNVYVHTNGRWIGGYRPAWYRTHPFMAVRDESGSRRVVCVDTDAEAFQLDAGPDAVRLFDADGEPTAKTRELLVFLEKLEQSRETTQVLVNQLAEAGLIVPWEISAKDPQGEGGYDVQGAYHIDEPAMRELPPETASKLLKSGALSVAYTQLLSEHRLQGLVRLYELRAEAKKQAGPAEDVDLEALFADDDDDNLTF